MQLCNMMIEIQTIFRALRFLPTLPLPGGGMPSWRRTPEKIERVTEMDIKKILRECEQNYAFSCLLYGSFYFGMIYILEMHAGVNINVGL